MRIVTTIAACVLCAGCIATHEPVVLQSSEPQQHLRLPISLAVVAEPSEFPDLDRELCERAVVDLRATQVFENVRDCDNRRLGDVTARASWHTLRRADDWCTGDRSIGLSLLTAGIVPACSCESGYTLQFVGGADQKGVVVHLDREACTLFGWLPLFLNFRSDYHWYGPADSGLRAQALREELLLARTELGRLAVPEAPNKSLQPTRAMKPFGTREAARFGPRG